MRTFSVLLLIGSLLAVTPAGCGGKSESKREAASRPAPTGRDKMAETDGVAAKDGKSEAKPWDSPKSREAAAEALMVKGTPQDPKQPTQQEQASGILTAGSFDDNLDPIPFRKFLQKMGQNTAVGALPGKFAGRRVTVVVKNDEGRPIGNARVQIAVNQGGKAVELISRSDGRAVFVLSLDELPSDDELRVTVTPPAGGQPVEQVVASGATRCDVIVPGSPGVLPIRLDLTLVLDTTGSMGDELEYLKAEIKSIVKAVKKQFPNVGQRYALVLYRDTGDEYEVRKLDFTDSLDEFRGRLNAQTANGGGDLPESMHRGLEEAAGLEWRPGNAARVLFLIGDAPPHAQHAGRTMDAVNALRKKGVAIYPVACSGVDAPCEFVMRSAAVLTGSQYLFLTDDSGVGGAHAEPHIPNYYVERLNQLMVRLIASELAGQAISPDPANILRTVGNPLLSKGER